MQQQNKTIGARLLGAVPFVTKGGRVADIGTDHAYLPIYLAQEGLISGALACDINRGPIQSARQNIGAAGFSGKIETLLTDGLHGVEEYHPDDVIIFGMGGELIVKILEEAPWVKEESIGLILQPMTRASVLRAYLTQNGFDITGESITFEDKYYQIIAARYCGKNSDLDERELLIGKKNIEARSPLFAGFVRHEIQVLEKIREGKRRSVSGESTEESRMIEQLEELLK